MDDIPLLSSMEQMETVLLRAMRKGPKGFRMFVAQEVAKRTKVAEEGEDGVETFVAMLALYGLSHIFQLDKRARDEDRTDEKGDELG